MPKTEEQTEYDAIVLGSGLGGTVLAAILSRQGASVLIVDAGTHPRFAIGESTTTQCSLLIQSLSERYDIPELGLLSSPAGIREQIAGTSGIKKAFGFAYHRPGMEHDPVEAIQFGLSDRYECHLFRQDVDSYMFHVALDYGARALQATAVEYVKIGATGVLVGTSARELRCRYVIDGGGASSFIAGDLGLREEPTRLHHHSRSVFTHMINVAPFDDCIRESHMHVPWHECTLQHVTPERAWIWVIPFGNQAGHVNRLTSVGLTLDPRLHGKAQLSPETEFQNFVGRFPSLHRQFEGSTAARPWVSTSRLQYSTHQSIGNRYCLMSSAAGFVDPIFSKGLENTFQRIVALVEPLLRAFAEDDFSSHRFSGMEEPHQTALNFNDRLANCTFTSWDDHDVWDAWVRIVALGTGLIEANLALGLEFYAHSANPAVLRGANEASISGSSHEPSGLGKLFDESMQTLEAYQANQIAAADTTEKLWKTMARHRHLKFPFPHPAFQNLRWALTNPGSRDIHYNGPHSKRWYARKDDPHLQESKA